LDETNQLIVNEIPWLRRYALILTKDADAADDLVQDALERAVRKRHLHRGQGHIRAWLYRILYTVFLNNRAANTRYLRNVRLDQAPQLWEPPVQDDRVYCHDIAQAIQQLPANQRNAIAMTVVDGLDHEEAADLLEIPQGTFRSRLSRGRDALRQMGG